jgi:hypothetical protein
MGFFNRLLNKISGRRTPLPEPVSTHIPDDDLTVELMGATEQVMDSARRLQVVVDLLKRQRDLRRGSRNARKL